uniref:Carbohydrate kinase PfkB domain-containing protein n=1 Tax=Polytomella parva TaxID=51329 RepID=A0A7S0VHX1_9CHLO|mmetsp:Transcript_6815/g.13390  ORF Transcript_6815/g.13390 Transcript_6815/m.13390 type:complete len:539 (+) Transcript_6815:141-1757(+)
MNSNYTATLSQNCPPRYSFCISINFKSNFSIRSSSIRHQLNLRTRAVSNAAIDSSNDINDGHLIEKYLKSKKIVGLGSCCLDYLALVKKYPKPDEKIRTERLEEQGGGNCANAMTAAARLGLQSNILSKIGMDGVSDSIIRELQSDGVGTDLLLRCPHKPSPFTYIIVDAQGGTRTCIHTPGAALQASDVSDPTLLDAALKDTDVLVFDGRLAEAALVLAQEALKRRGERRLCKSSGGACKEGLKLLVEGERLRVGLGSLLAVADHVTTSEGFPRAWTGESNPYDAILAATLRLPRVKSFVSTLGVRGSILVVPVSEDRLGNGSMGEIRTVSLADLAKELSDRAHANLKNIGSTSKPVACISASGIQIQEGEVEGTAEVVRLVFSEGWRTSETKGEGEEERTRRGNVEERMMEQLPGAFVDDVPLTTPFPRNSSLLAHVYFATAAVMPNSAVVDTTGAGDAFVGTLALGLALGLSPPATLRLAAAVAACKCTALGARAGLPWTRPQQSMADKKSADSMTNSAVATQVPLLISTLRSLG